MQIYSKIYLRLLPPVGAALLILIGCSTTSKMARPLGDFSAATSDATSVTTAALSIVQAADQDEMVTKGSKLSSLREGSLPEFLHPNDVLQRQLVLQALSTYAATLKTLSGVDRSADVQKSFNSLGASIDSTVTTINKLNTGSATQIPSGVVSSLVSLGANFIDAYMVAEREKAIQMALEKSDKTVARICSLLAAELTPPHGVIYDQLQHAYRTQEEVASDSFQAVVDAANTPGDPKAKAASKPAATPKPSDLAPSVKTFIGVRNKKEYSLALLGSLASSYRKIAQAHTALKIQSENGPKSNLELRALSAEIDNVKLLYSQVSK